MMTLYAAYRASRCLLGVVVDVVLYGQQVVGHSLECQLVYEWRDWVETAV